jgi:methylated-DNA-[protein]-cysteine S-methyltransferase
MTSFQKKVHEIVKKIPEGKILSYKTMAKLAGNPKAWRTVGNILNKNQNPKIPCHRIIKSDGQIGGYNRGTKKKIVLLKKEGLIIKNGKLLRTGKVLQKQGFKI